MKPPPIVSAGVIGSLAIGLSFYISVALFLELQGLPPDMRMIETVMASWFHVASLEIDFGLRLDPLSAIFSLVITGVGLLIHIYSIGYMGHDKTPAKYFSYLNLFCFSMLMLVLGSSLPVMFLGWEGVGLCSYLLIGYWYEDDEKASAGKKAFIVNRIGDFGFLLGILMIFSQFGTLDFKELQSAVSLAQGLDPAIVTAICIFLFLGCTGKSAQFPLYIWLPDAMAGPTPVSALIHAATMVTSGIYLLSRLSFLFSLSPDALSVIAWVGAATAFFAATIALVQRDIKKILAYSTVSQLGYMFLACGVGAYGAGVFHVVTHAFFKALLFLGAGSVIYGMHHEQDILKMGGLRSRMPKTFAVMAIAWLSISGIPPFSGFFSKDEILWMAFSSHRGAPALWALSALTAVFTAFYMTRLIMLTFLGKPRFDSHHSPHESPAVMLVPLYILAGLSTFGGFMGVPHHSWIEGWLAPVITPMEHSVAHASMEYFFMALSITGAIAGIFSACKIFSIPRAAEAARNKFIRLYQVVFNKFYVDEVYYYFFVRPLMVFSRALWKGFDVGFIDRLVLGFGRVSMWSGQTIRLTHTGSLQAYLVILMIGMVVTLGYLIYGLG